MDLDSHPDAIAIRAKSTGSELVWLQQPPSNTPWQAHVIDEEVGANQFKTMWIDDGDYKRLLIICAGSRQGQLIIFWVDDPDNDWSRTSKIMKTIIGKELVQNIKKRILFKVGFPTIGVLFISKKNLNKCKGRRLYQH